MYILVKASRVRLFDPEVAIKHSVITFVFSREGSLERREVSFFFAIVPLEGIQNSPAGCEPCMYATARILAPGAFEFLISEGIAM